MSDRARIDEVLANASDPRRMTERVEAQLERARDDVNAGGSGIAVDSRILYAVLHNWLAMRAIVEALAAYAPVYWPGSGVIACAACGAELRANDDTKGHFTGCSHRQARELLAKPIEFEGIRTEVSE